LLVYEKTAISYGAMGWYEGLHGDLEQEKHNVYWVDPQKGEVKVVVDDFVQPNPSSGSSKRFTANSSLTMPALQ
jgi:hypothetical protein